MRTDPNEAAAQRAYEAAGLDPGQRVGRIWSGRICHAHRVAFATYLRMGPHFSRAHAAPPEYYAQQAF